MIVGGYLSHNATLMLFHPSNTDENICPDFQQIRAWRKTNWSNDSPFPANLFESYELGTTTVLSNQFGLNSVRVEHPHRLWFVCGPIRHHEQ